MIPAALGLCRRQVKVFKGHADIYYAEPAEGKGGKRGIGGWKIVKKKDGGFLDRAFINFFIFVVVEKIYDTVCCVLQLQYKTAGRTKPTDEK